MVLLLLLPLLLLPTLESTSEAKVGLTAIEEAEAEVTVEPPEKNLPPAPPFALPDDEGTADDDESGLLSGAEALSLICHLMWHEPANCGRLVSSIKWNEMVNLGRLFFCERLLSIVMV